MTESRVFLQETAIGRLVEASLFDEVSDEHLALWDKDWVPAMQTFCSGYSPTETPEDAHWDWRRKASGWRQLLSYQSFALLCRGELQGLMLVNNITSARLSKQFGKPLIYINFVATAPWNRPEMQSPPKFRGVGRAFILAAIETSREAGFKGRVALHSLPNAEDFYETKCGFTRLGSDSSHQNLAYFEMTESQADNFRRV